MREGPVGDQGDGPYSAGRGGAGNIDGINEPRTSLPNDEEIVPETAILPSKVESHHVGRGGAGNELHAHNSKSDQHGFNKKEGGGLGEKIKSMFASHDK